MSIIVATAPVCDTVEKTVQISLRRLKLKLLAHKHNKNPLMPAIHRQERTESSHLRGRAGAKDITPLHQDIPSTMREELMELDRLELLQETTTTAPRLFESIILLQWRESLLIDSKTDTNQGKTTTGSTALTRTTLESIDVQMMTERIRLHSKLSAPYGWRNQTRGLFDAPTHYHLSIQHPQKSLLTRALQMSLPLPPYFTACCCSKHSNGGN